MGNSIIINTPAGDTGKTFLNKHSGTVMIIVAACMWSVMGVFSRMLGAYGFDSLHLTTMRVTIGGIGFLLILFFFRSPSERRIRKCHIPLFLMLGGIAIPVMSVGCLYSARITSLGTASILNNTAPIWVILMSAVIFKDAITIKKVVAVLLAFGGCVLLSGIGIGDNINFLGYLVGIISGITYGMYSILCKLLYKHYSSFTTIAYGFALAGIVTILICKPGKMLSIFMAAEDKISLFFLILAFGMITAILPFMLFSTGLKVVDAGKAAVFATMEPVMATVVGIFAYGEMPGIPAFIGMLCILCAVISLNIEKK